MIIIGFGATMITIAITIGLILGAAHTPEAVAIAVMGAYLVCVIPLLIIVLLKGKKSAQ
jgi:hypothetical protein